jgi:hypothetical protein
MTEYGLGAAHSGVAGAAAGKKMGNAAGAVLNKASRALDSAGKPASAAPRPAASRALAAQNPAPAAQPPQPSTAGAPAAPRALPDISVITPGLERRDLLAKAGAPSMKITSMERGEMVEKYWYRGDHGDTVIVVLRNGKVATVSGPTVLP